MSNIFSRIGPPETAPQAGIPKDGGRAKRAAAVS